MLLRGSRTPRQAVLRASILNSALISPSRLRLASQLPRGRSYSEGPPSHNQPSQSHPTPKPHTKPTPTLPKRPPPPPPQQSTARHEVQEGTSALSVPWNPPGGGGGPGPGGGSIFRITKNPFFDAALTTIVGLAMGVFTLRRS